MRSYESVTIFPGWCEGQGLGPESIETIRGLMAKNCVVFLFVNGDQVMEAADFLHTLTAVDGGAYVFKSWHKVTVKKVPRTHREGPRGELHNRERQGRSGGPAAAEPSGGHPAGQHQ